MEIITETVPTGEAAPQVPETTGESNQAEVQPEPTETTGGEGSGEATGGEAGEHTESTISGDAEPTAPAVDTVTYQFNHQKTTVPLAEVPALIQKTLHQNQTLEGYVDRMRFIASARGEELPAFVERLEKSLEAHERQALIEKCGGNEEAANQLYDLQLEKRRSGFKSFSQQAEEEAAKARDDLTRRMGDQLAELQEEFPEVRELLDLPDEVVATAADKEISLLDSYLRWQYRNGKRAAAAAAQQQAAAAASSGPLGGGSDPAATVDAASAAFIAAVKQHM